MCTELHGHAYTFSKMSKRDTHVDGLASSYSVIVEHIDNEKIIANFDLNACTKFSDFKGKKHQKR